MRKVVMTGLGLGGAAVVLSSCGTDMSAQTLLTTLDREARIVCSGKQVTTVDGVETTTCDGFTIRVYDSRLALEQKVSKGNPDPTITGYNWQISAASIQTARLIRATVGGHLVTNIANGGEQLPQQAPRGQGG